MLRWVHDALRVVKISVCFSKKMWTIRQGITCATLACHISVAAIINLVNVHSEIYGNLIYCRFPLYYLCLISFHCRSSPWKLTSFDPVRWKGWNSNKKNLDAKINLPNTNEIPVLTLFTDGTIFSHCWGEYRNQLGLHNGTEWYNTGDNTTSIICCLLLLIWNPWDMVLFVWYKSALNKFKQDCKEGFSVLLRPCKHAIVTLYWITALYQGRN